MNNYKINNINDKLKLPFELFSIDVIKSRLEELKKEDNPISNFYELDKATKKKLEKMVIRIMLVFLLILNF